jgi:MFS family permease
MPACKHAARYHSAAAFVVSMTACMLAVRLAGTLADRYGRRPLLIVAWALMALRLAIAAIARTSGQVVAKHALDGLAAAAWVTDRLGGPRRAGEAQAIAGTSMVFGSALGPYLSALWIETLGYRGLFGALAGVGVVATLVVLLAVPESLVRDGRTRAEPASRRLPELASAGPTWSSTSCPATTCTSACSLPCSPTPRSSTAAATCATSPSRAG